MAKVTSIFKMIGSQSTRLSRPEEAISYIFDKRKTTPDICNEQYLDLENPIDSWFTHPVQNTEKERKFIHAMLCPYGDSIPNNTMLKELVDGLLNLFHEYPIFSAIHTDHPHSPHIHFLIHPRNIYTAKAWQQSPADLKTQKKRISFLLEELGLYGISNAHERNKNNWDGNDKPVEIPTSVYYSLPTLYSALSEDYASLSKGSADLTKNNIIVTSPFVNDTITEIPNTFQMMETVFNDTANNTFHIYSKTTNGIESIDWSELKEYTYVKR